MTTQRKQRICPVSYTHLMCKAWEEQKNEGRELGREEGRIRQAKVTALKLQKKGHSIEDIAECVDFDEETVKKWLVS